MSRPRRESVRIAYVEIGLSDGVRWRINPQTQSIVEIKELSGDLLVSRPARLDAFNAALEAEQRRRHANP